MMTTSMYSGGKLGNGSKAMATTRMMIYGHLTLLYRLPSSMHLVYCCSLVG